MDVTLDTTCLIDLAERRRPHAGYLQQLAWMHDQRQITLRVVAIGACERQPDGVYANDLCAFRSRLEDVGLGHVQILRPLFHWGLTFDEWSCWAVGEPDLLEQRIHAVLFGQMPYLWGDYAAQGDEQHSLELLYARWRSARCAAAVMWGHIYHGGQMFVTRDDAFLHHGARKALHELGAGSILTPRDAAARLSGDVVA